MKTHVFEIYYREKNSTSRFQGIRQIFKMHYLLKEVTGTLPTAFINTKEHQTTRAISQSMALSTTDQDTSRKEEEATKKMFCLYKHTNKTK